jgi:hypothetical protein
MTKQALLKSSALDSNKGFQLNEERQIKNMARVTAVQGCTRVATTEIKPDN